MPNEDWPAYYAVTIDRPAWGNLVFAIDRFGAEGEAGGRLAVDLGCGAGRDTRALLARGWRVLALDAEPAAIEALVAATPPGDRARLEARVADLVEAELPACDLVNANVSLQFVPRDRFDGTWRRIVSSVRPGGRVAAMVYGDRDQDAGDPALACVPEAVVRTPLAGFEVERWVEREEDTTLALGDPHHLHLFELVARRPL